ncbi:MAG: T9SS type A sorting domain-containing protein [Bacteroidales bacterium]|nr:T9SS type A sorting domain-containing protein [Bacteroidales bacterium]
MAINQLPTGTYIIRVIHENNMFAKKLIVR